MTLVESLAAFSVLFIIYIYIFFIVVDHFVSFRLVFVQAAFDVLCIYIQL